MRIRRTPFAALLSLCLGCQTAHPGTGAPAELCNTPGRQALAEQIVARGGRLLADEKDWDNSVDPATKAKMGQPLSEVVLPQDKFSVQDVRQAKMIFPEAQISAPFTLDEETEGSE